MHPFISALRVFGFRSRRAAALAISIGILSGSTFAQQSATVYGEEFVKAGETLKISITLDKAPSIKGAMLQLTIRGPRAGFGYGVGLTAGQVNYTADFPVPEGATGGTWSIDKVTFQTGGGESYELPFKKYSFQVIPKANVTYPTAADVGVIPSQAQLLRTEALRLLARIQDLKGQIAERKNDTKLLKLLHQNVDDAIKALGETENTFRSLDSSAKQQGPSQIFFDDLRTSYHEADRLIMAQGDRSSDDALFQLVDFAQKSSDSPIYPPIAQAVLRAFEQNELAYKTVADAQSLTFDLELTSAPQGAAVSYRRRGDDFKPAPSPTDSTIKALTFAIWLVRFEKDGFRPVEREHDTFRDSNHVINVELPKVK